MLVCTISVIQKKAADSVRSIEFESPSPVQVAMEHGEFMIEKKDGTSARGKFVDACLLGILREEWKEPKILTRTEKK
jgi:hypothetical protein